MFTSIFLETLGRQEEIKQLARTILQTAAPPPLQQPASPVNKLESYYNY